MNEDNNDRDYDVIGEPVEEDSSIGRFVTVPKMVFISTFLFFILWLFLKWNVFVAALIPIGLYTSVMLLTNEPEKIGSTSVESITAGDKMKEELKDAYDDINLIGNISQKIENLEIMNLGLEIYQTGLQIIEFLEKNPNKIAASLTFFNYDIPTALRILDNYYTLEKENISESKLSSARVNTIKSMEILEKRFANQRDGYYQNILTDLSLDTDILSKTLEQAENIKKEEGAKANTDYILKGIDDVYKDLKNSEEKEWKKLLLQCHMMI